MNDYMITMVGVIGTLCGIIFGYVGYRRVMQRDSTEHGKNDGVLISDVGYIKAGIDNLTRKQEMAELRHFELAERVTKVEESSKQAHKRLDRMEKVKEE